MVILVCCCVLVLAGCAFRLGQYSGRNLLLLDLEQSGAARREMIGKLAQLEGARVVLRD
jgi:hypothetical protein